MNDCAHPARIELEDGVAVCPRCEAVIEVGGPVEVLPACPSHLKDTGRAVEPT